MALPGQGLPAAHAAAPGPRLGAGLHHVPRVAVGAAEVRLHHLEECGVVVSSGSACQATKDQLSPALSALGLTKDPARRVLRFSFSHYTTMEDIERLLSALVEVEQQLESLVPAPEEAR